jgi:hypothetical protein
MFLANGLPNQQYKTQKYVIYTFLWPSLETAKTDTFSSNEKGYISDGH